MGLDSTLHLQRWQGIKMGEEYKRLIEKLKETLAFTAPEDILNKFKMAIEDYLEDTFVINEQKDKEITSLKRMLKSTTKELITQDVIIHDLNVQINILTSASEKDLDTISKRNEEIKELKKSKESEFAIPKKLFDKY